MKKFFDWIERSDSSVIAAAAVVTLLILIFLIAFATVVGVL